MATTVKAIALRHCWISVHRAPWWLPVKHHGVGCGGDGTQWLLGTLHIGRGISGLLLPSCLQKSPEYSLSGPTLAMGSSRRTHGTLRWFILSIGSGG